MASYVGKTEMILPSIPVRICFQGRSICVNAILDTCSTDSFISEAAIRKLGIKGVQTTIAVSTIEQQAIPMITKVVNGLEVTNLTGSVSATLPFCYSNSSLPISNLDILHREDLRSWPHLKDIPFQFVDAEVGLLLGMNAIDILQPLEFIRGKDQEPFAVRHKLGCAFYGPKSGTTLSSFASRISVNRIKVETDQMIKRLFEQEFLDAADTTLGPSADDLKWKNQVESTLRVQEDGHWEIGLPFREETPVFRNNRTQAVQRLNGLKSRLSRSADLKDEYNKFIQNMLEQGYAEKDPHQESGEEGKNLVCRSPSSFSQAKEEVASCV